MKILITTIIICIAATCLQGQADRAETKKSPGRPAKTKPCCENLVVRVAKLHIDTAQLESYKAILEEEIEASVRIEPGVLSLYAVADKNDPAYITVFEIYANQEAYLAHLKTPHFLKYKTATKEMVKSLELMETAPIALKAKRKLRGINQ